MKARIQLYEKQYADCITTIGSIDALNVYDLFPSYTNLFRIQNEYNSEVILDVEYKENDYSNWVH